MGDVGAYFESAFRSFLSEEAENIVSGVHEQSLCGQLALRLHAYKAQYGLDSYFVDTEYDRKQHGELKTILRHGERVKIRCDLIVHTRGRQLRDNLIAIEMKKAGQSARALARREEDRVRLMALTMKPDNKTVWSADGIAHPEDVCGYELGLFIEIDKGNRTYVLEEFKLGVSSGKKTGRF